MNLSEEAGMSVLKDQPAAKVPRRPEHGHYDLWSGLSEFKSVEILFSYISLLIAAFSILRKKKSVSILPNHVLQCFIIQIYVYTDKRCGN